MEADQSLTALLARRDQVRSTRPSPVVAPSEDLFKPRSTPAPTMTAEETDAPAPGVTAVKTAEEKPKAPEEATTTSKLLAAKKRARKK